MSSVAAVVLAAGASSRLGRPKQLLPFNGGTLVSHAAEVTLAAGCSPVVVVLGAAADRIRLELARLNVTVVVNVDWESGPGSSVRAGVAAVDRADAVVFLTCDQPLVDAAHILRLIDAYRSERRPMVASGYDGTAGVPALFDRSCFAALSTIAPTAGAKQLLARRPDAVTIVPCPAGAFDLDTPADVERWQADMSSRIMEEVS